MTRPIAVWMRLVSSIRALIAMESGDCCSRSILLARTTTAMSWAVLLLGTSVVCASQAFADEWPSRVVKVIVPYGAGGTSDVLGRITAERLSAVFGQSFIVETRPGANGAIGTEHVVRAPADGYTLYEAGGAQFSVLPLIQNIPYDPLKDLTPISSIASNGMVLAVNSDLPVHSVRELIDYTRANPGVINYGSVGRGSSSSLVPALFAARENLKLVEVPFTAGPAIITALIGNTVQMFFGNISDAISVMHSDKVRILAFSTAQRLPDFPDVPTVSETVPGFIMTAWNAYFAPAGTPATIVARIAQALGQICREPNVIKAMSRLGFDAVGSTPEELAEAIRTDLPIYRAAAEAAGLIRK
jgi:tripartite-type tricarboxylate transporter receptor subunit TctC